MILRFILSFYAIAFILITASGAFAAERAQFREIEALCKKAGGSYGCCLSYAHHYIPLGGVATKQGELCPEGLAPAASTPIKCMQELQWCVSAPAEPLPDAAAKP